MTLNLRRAAAVAALAVVLTGSLAGCRVSYTDSTTANGGGINRTPVPVATTAPQPTETSEPAPTQAPPAPSVPGSYESPYALDGNTTMSFEAMLAESPSGEVYFLAGNPDATLSITGGSTLSAGEWDGLDALKTDLGYDLRLASDYGWITIGSPETGDFIEIVIETKEG